VTATTVIFENGAPFRGMARLKITAFTNELERERFTRRAIKNAFYRAAKRARPGSVPWGSAAGIRPASLVTKLLQSGLTERQAVSAFTRDYFVSPARAALALDAARAELDARRGFSPRDAAVYVGIPFCPTRCAYCSFVSVGVEKSLKLLEPFLGALLAEIDALADAVRDTGARIVTVYIGGGTPTTLPDDMLAALLTRLTDALDLSALREFTVEAGRPDTITRENMSLLRKYGVDRVSVNPQTFSDEVLRVIGRRHTSEDTRRAVGLAREAGFAALNMDLIAGLPADTEDGFRASLDEVLAIAPENVTVHALSLKRGSRVKLEAIPVPSGEAVSAMLEYAYGALRGRGMSPYYLYRQKFSSGGFENTGWTAPGHASLYNIAMMDEALTVLALGGGGVTKLVSGRNGKIERIFNPKYPYEYIERRDEIVRRKREIHDFLLTERDHHAV
jgi:oxygen-independent coproporphyrinogen-3 oxidase